jgi:nitrogen fixation protein FixH
MDDFDREIETARTVASRPLSGKLVLFYLVAFFGTIMAVNGVLVYEALSTLSGVDTDSAYQAGRMFEHDVAMAKAQDARGWQVEANLTPGGAGLRVDLSVRDANGRPVSDLDAHAVFERPIDRRQDRTLDLVVDGGGRFHGLVEVAPGQWEVVLELSRRGERMFRSVNRYVLR